MVFVTSSMARMVTATEKFVGIIQRFHSRMKNLPL